MTRDELIADLRQQVTTLSRLLEIALANQPARPLTDAERAKNYRDRLKNRHENVTNKRDENVTERDERARNRHENVTHQRDERVTLLPLEPPIRERDLATAHDLRETGGAGGGRHENVTKRDAA